MSSTETKILAICKEADELLYSLSVTDGSGTGEYSKGTSVEIIADDPDDDDDMSFLKWEVIRGSPKIEDRTAPVTELIMPGDAVSIKAVYEKKEEVLYRLRVFSGEGGGEYMEGERVTIEAREAPRGYDFMEWIVLSGTEVDIEDETSSVTTLVMPKSAVTVRAKYKVTIQDLKYELVVKNGEGDGKYAVGEDVAIIANEASFGEEFSEWEVIEGTNVDIKDKNDPTTRLTMPEGDVTIIARYISIIVEYELTVRSGEGGGEYEEGSEVTITADDPPSSSEEFKKWEIIKGNPAIDDSSAATTTLRMPDSDVTVSATYSAIIPDTYQLTVRSGKGSGDYTPGSKIAIRAETDSSETFEKWVIQAGVPYIEDPFSSNTILTMPEGDTIVKATFTVQPSSFELVVKSASIVSPTTPDNKYPTNTQVTITADDPPTNQEFNMWNIRDGDATIKDKNAATTQITIEQSDVTIEATYTVITPPEPEPDEVLLLVDFGKGSGKYDAGSTVFISADIPPNPDQTIFKLWVINEGEATIADPAAANTDITLKDVDVIITATYEEVDDSSDPDSEDDNDAILYELNVRRGEGEGYYRAGTALTVTASEPPMGQFFWEWSILQGDPILDDVYAMSTLLIMPAENVTIRARYRETLDFSLKVRNGSGTGVYKVGAVVPIVAEEPKMGEVFNGWFVGMGQPEIADVNMAATTLTMPGVNVVIRATYTMAT